MTLQHKMTLFFTIVAAVGLIFGFMEYERTKSRYWLFFALFQSVLFILDAHSLPVHLFGGQ